jgi:protein phosphatase
VAIFDWCTVSEQAGLPANEDCVLAEPGYGVFVIADGMGGRPGGAQASRVAVRAFMDTLRRVKPENLTNPLALKKAVEKANAAVLAVSRADPNMAGMGTTLSAVILTESDSKFVHVGDSRIYRFAEGSLEQLTEDHTLVSELVAREYMSEDAAKDSSLRNVLSRAVGTRPKVEPDIEDLSLWPEDWLLLATDGLYKTLPQARIAKVMAAETKNGARAICRALAKAAVEAGPQDNVTLAVVRPLGGGQNAK